MSRYYDQYPPYVPVAVRRARAAKEVAKRIKKGERISPVQIEGRTIAATFWGKAWCANLEGYSDYANRLPRGRTYARNGSVVHLTIAKGRIEALVSGSQLYKVHIDIDALSKPNWHALKRESAGEMGTLVELLQGRLSTAMMELVSGREYGLFPKPKEIKMRCSCPDGAYMCKHLAAVLYGVGNRLDSSPELLFVLRGVNHQELIEQAIPSAPLRKSGTTPTIAIDDLGAIFDIEIGDAPITNAEATILANSVANQAVKKARTVKKVSTIKATATIPDRTAAKHAVTTTRTKQTSSAKKKTNAKLVPKKP